MSSDYQGLCLKMSGSSEEIILSTSIKGMIDDRELKEAFATR